MDEQTTRSPRTQPRQFATLAATVVATSLVGILAVLLNAARQSHTGAPEGTPAPSSLGGIGLTLRMVDGMNGWALTGKAVLRTTDGGYDFRNVTPHESTTVRGSVAAFLTATNAWIAVPPTTS